MAVTLQSILLLFSVFTVTVTSAFHNSESLNSDSPYETLNSDSPYVVESKHRISDEDFKIITRRQLMHYGDQDDEYWAKGGTVKVDPELKFENPRLKNAYIALQAWKKAIISDPYNITLNWVGANVCGYTGVFCSPSLKDPKIRVVYGIDINHGDIAGYLPPELGLLTDLALFHVNTNRFCGVVPHTFKNMTLLYELDLSNNRFAGDFPKVVLELPGLKFLDIRFNEFEGAIPKALFEKPLDAVFINNNRFNDDIPANVGNSTVSVMVIANTKMSGCVPPSLGNMGDNLDEIILTNNNFSACLPLDLGRLKNVTVFDVSFGNFVGTLPKGIGEMKSLEILNIAHNRLTGDIPETICKLPNLVNFTYSYNFFTKEAPSCLYKKDVSIDHERNCIPGSSDQRPKQQCSEFFSKPPIDCSGKGGTCKPVRKSVSTPPSPKKPTAPVSPPPPCNKPPPPAPYTPTLPPFHGKTPPPAYDIEDVDEETGCPEDLYPPPPQYVSPPLPPLP